MCDICISIFPHDFSILHFIPRLKFIRDLLSGMAAQSSECASGGVRIRPSDKMEMLDEEKLIFVITLKSLTWFPARPMSFLSWEKHFRFALLIFSQNMSNTEQLSWVSFFIVRPFHTIRILETWKKLSVYLSVFIIRSKRWHQGLHHLTAKPHQTLVTDWRAASSRG